MDLDIFIPLIYIAVIGGLASISTKWYWLYRTKKLKEEKKEIEINEKNEIFKKFNDLCDNAPRIKAELDRQIDSQRKAGVADAQMSGLLTYKSIVDIIAVQPDIAKAIGSPIVQGGLKIITKLPKWIGGVMGS